MFDEHHDRTQFPQNVSTVVINGIWVSLIGSTERTPRDPQAETVRVAMTVEFEGDPDDAIEQFG